jgi:pimeloyl-ACP methyl ester carboxylesterase
MEPRIQYAKTSDGANIAYAVFGDGPPIVCSSGSLGDLHLYSSGALELVTQATDRLVGLGWRVIMYDSRGTGSSDRDNMDFTLEARLRDLEAVIERTGVNRFALWGRRQGGPVTIAYAVRHPDRVSHLFLAGTGARGADWYQSIPAMRMTQGAKEMAEDDWEYYTLALANAITGFGGAEVANRTAAAYRAGMSSTAYLAYREASEKIDATDLLPLVKAPTLVLHNTTSPYSNLELLRGLASQIPDARLVSTEDGVRAIDGFLREGQMQAAAAPELPSGMSAILFADIADSTALTERLGDAAFRAKARELGASLRALVRECSGTPVEGPTLGDGVLAVFTSAREAIEAARRCAKAGDDAGLPLHLGIHAGDVTREKDPDGRDNVYGGAINIASRISALSAPSEVLVSDTVRSLARTSAGVRFDDRGEQALKGVGEAVRVWAVVPSDDQAQA